jgi:hypothetical protein
MRSKTPFARWAAVGAAWVLGGLASAASAQVVYNNASTAGESYARGLGDVIRSEGEYNLNSSQAAINMTQARRASIQNQQLAAQTYFDMRKMNRAYQAEERGPRPTMEQIVRMAQSGMPKELSPSQLDSISGKINWPALLNTPTYAESRKKIEDVFAKRAKYGGMAFDDEQTLWQTTNAMLEQLNDQIRDVPPASYLASKKFIQSLAYEGQKPSG